MGASDQQRAWNRPGLNQWRTVRKLTDVQRAEIRRRIAAGERTADLAAEYRVARSTINRYR